MKKISKALIAAAAAVAFAVVPGTSAFAIGWGAPSDQYVASDGYTYCPTDGTESDGYTSDGYASSDQYLTPAPDANYTSDGYTQSDHSIRCYAPEVRTANIDLGNGVSAVVIAHGGSIEEPDITATQAKNTSINAGWEAPAPRSLVIKPTEKNGATSATIIYNLGEKYNGYSTKVFAEHGDGTTDVYDGSQVTDKLATVEATKLSTFTLVVRQLTPGQTDDTTTSISNPTTTPVTTPVKKTTSNTSAKSPQTGLFFFADLFADLF